ncbi:hypothetical protein J6590_077654 [Homalodisca vitripennis]|nr:hypothetical protein J6590_077654 [Homalodisca vitripennis]
MLLQFLSTFELQEVGGTLPARLERQGRCDDKAGEHTNRIKLDLCRDKLGMNLPASAIQRPGRSGSAAVGPKPSPDVRKRHCTSSFALSATSTSERFITTEINRRVLAPRCGKTCPQRLEVIKRVTAQHGVRNIWTQDSRLLCMSSGGHSPVSQTFSHRTKFPYFNN